ncbi:MAG: family 43 glycosylhydrolase [Bacteroidales bacterium]|nr:family 43 glycosylhydrolase [Bacteroidales bacterium]
MPVIQTKYTADPAPMVYDGTVYLYTTHDEDGARGFQMFDWLLYTSTDMVNWTDHGAVASLDDFAWYEGKNGAWAECVVERGGKFYMYCPIHGHGIGVLVADTPYGPFKDPLGEPLVWQKEHWEDIDPSVFIDDDGQAYMYWGNPNVYWVKLNEDMVSLGGEIHKLDYKIDFYQEGPWFYKHDGRYYLAFASTCCPEGIGYAMADSPEGPWKSMGHIMDRTWRTRGNHPGIIEYKGQSYVFGLNYDLWHLTTFKHAEQRSVSVAPMYYEPDGSIRKVPYWLDNVVEQVESFNPYRRVEAETMAWGYGLKTRVDAEHGIVINDIDAGEHLLVKGVDFGKKGARSLTACVLAEAAGCIEVHLDAPDGPLAGTLAVKPGKGWTQQSCKLKGATGVRDLYFVFTEGGFEWDWWKMK